MKKVFYLLSIALMAMAFVACSSSKNTPEGVVDAYLKAMQKNDTRKALEMFHFSKELTPEEFDEYVQMVDDKVKKQNEKKGGIESWEIQAPELAEDAQSAVVRYTVKYGDGSEDIPVKTVQCTIHHPYTPPEQNLTEIVRMTPLFPNTYVAYLTGIGRTEIMALLVCDELDGRCKKTGQKSQTKKNRSKQMSVIHK